MRKIGIAIGSNDGKNVVSTHMGMAEYFHIYDLFEDGKTSFIEKRKNTSPDEKGKHGLVKKMKGAIEIFKNADVIIGKKISPNFINIAAKTKFQPVVIEIDEISEIMKEIAKHFGEIYELIEQRKSGERSKNIPKLAKGQK